MYDIIGPGTKARIPWQIMFKLNLIRNSGLAASLSHRSTSASDSVLTPAPGRTRTLSPGLELVTPQERSESEYPQSGSRPPGNRHRAGRGGDSEPTGRPGGGRARRRLVTPGGTAARSR